MVPEGGAENQRGPHQEITRPDSKERDTVEDSTRAIIPGERAAIDIWSSGGA